MLSPKAIEAILKLKIFGGDLSFRDIFKEEKPKHLNKEVLEKAEEELKSKLKNNV